MIYLGQELQRKLIPLFHYALRPGGYLFLGPSESPTSHKEVFGTVDQKHRIFERMDTLPRPAVTFPLAEVSRAKQPGARLLPEAEERDLPRRLERIILQRYRPACVTVKANGDAVYFSGRLNDYLEQPTGSPDVNLVNMAREGLRIPLRGSPQGGDRARADRSEADLGSKERRNEPGRSHRGAARRVPCRQPLHGRI